MSGYDIQYSTLAEVFPFLPSRSVRDLLHSSPSCNRRQYRDVEATQRRTHEFRLDHCCVDCTSKPYLFMVSAATVVLMNAKNCFAVSLFFDELTMTHACWIGG